MLHIHLYEKGLPMTKKELANSLHDQKYNCAQSVACAFSEELNVDRQLLFKMCEGFGFGMGCAKGTCGAISGAIALLGLKNSDGNLDAPTTKADTYKLSAELLEKFYEKNGSTICSELKGLESGKVLRSCPGCIEDAVELVQEILKL